MVHTFLAFANLKIKSHVNYRAVVSQQEGRDWWKIPKVGILNYKEGVVEMHKVVPELIKSKHILF